MKISAFIYFLKYGKLKLLVNFYISILKSLITFVKIEMITDEKKTLNFGSQRRIFYISFILFILFYISLFKNKNRNRLSKFTSNFSLPDSLTS